MNKRILIVDDDHGVCDSFAILLRGEGYDIDALTDSEKAAVLVKKCRYDVCLFDYKMRGLSGIDLLKMIKSVDPRCPVFIISGMLNINKLCKKEMDAGLIAGIISKPFDVEAMLRRIAAAVSADP